MLAEDQDRLAAGQQIGHYEIIRLLDDSVLTKRYGEHEPEFQRLVEMTHEDSNVGWISHSSVCIREAWSYTCYSEDSFGADRQLSVNRWNSYRAILAALNAESITKDGGTSRQAFVPVSIEVARPTDDNPFETEISEKGHVYSPIEPAPIVSSLDGISGHNATTVYTRLADKWYLCYRLSIGKPE
jgi:hypothetical protein